MYQRWSVIDVTRSELPAFLRAEIDHRGLDASRLARKAGVDKSTLSKLLNNPEIRPEFATLEKLSRALAVPLVRLMVAAGVDPGDLEISIDELQDAMLFQAVPELQPVAHLMSSFSPEERRALLAYARLLESERQAAQSGDQ